MPVNQQRYRQILNRSFTEIINLAAPGRTLPPGNYDLLVLLTPENRYSINARYFTSEHYANWVEIR